MLVKNFDHLWELAKEKQGKRIAVVSADDVEILHIIDMAEAEGLAEFVLLGDADTMREIIAKEGFKIKAELLHQPDHAQAAQKAVEMVVGGEAGTLMKGMLHSSTFLKAILNKEKGLNTGRHITQVSLMEKEDADGLMLLTDCAISVAPDLMGKKEILENAVDLARGLGYEKPKAAALASVEVVNPAMPETVDAALLTMMANRGQIKNCIVDGPLAFDNAYSAEAARIKGIDSPVAGNADILLMPNLTVGNAVSKAISYVGKKNLIAATVGARVPVVFNSRTETDKGKLYSIALANYLVD
ncbi:bifunctional enoyl-CoA hydratase/phosphate acetyltransferase [Ruminococcaceae bacterium OttesenSCG-928-D13]|nr:bifunctional enoyl-CoA hydratase/phosphate acetyltransferase [Ruminococcaceae bacterium OttesenSCG-928-D13]